jgi:hypothetical protein
MDTTDFRTQMNADDTKEGKHFMSKRLLVIISYWLGNTKTKTIGMGNSVSHRGSISVRVDMFSDRIMKNQMKKECQESFQLFSMVSSVTFVLYCYGLLQNICQYLAILLRFESA